MLLWNSCRFVHKLWCSCVGQLNCCLDWGLIIGVDLHGCMGVCVVLDVVVGGSYGSTVPSSIFGFMCLGFDLVLRLCLVELWV